MKKIKTNIKKKEYLKEEEIEGLAYQEDYEWNIIKPYPNIKKQLWHGMGGSFTESSCYNILKLPKEKQEEVLKKYFGKDGLDYNLGRISIASNDFCLESYEYTKKEDLSDFTVKKDEEYILPVLKEVLKEKDLTIIASPWSPPAFMKEEKDLYHGKKLKKEYYSLFGKYLKKFFDAYKELGIPVQYFTLQNEPNASQKWESCKYKKEELKELFSSVEKELNKEDPKLLVWDHNKENLLEVCDTLLTKSPMIKGVAFHSYMGTHSKNLELATKKYKDMLFFHTEGCQGFKEYNEEEWIFDAEMYLMDLIEDINHGAHGYIDWNLVLDRKGGPNHKENYCKSPVMLNKEENDFILTPIYYYLCHIGKFIKKGYTIIPLDTYRPDILGVAATNNERIVITLLNPCNYEIEVDVVVNEKRVHDRIESHTIVTYID